MPDRNVLQPFCAVAESVASGGAVLVLVIYHAIRCSRKSPYSSRMLYAIPFW
jgi:hypothetical protein